MPDAPIAGIFHWQASQQGIRESKKINYYLLRARVITPDSDGDADMHAVRTRSDLTPGTPAPVRRRVAPQKDSVYVVIRRARAVQRIRWVTKRYTFRPQPQ